MSNPFTTLAEKQISNPIKARSRATAKRAEKKKEDQETLHRLWRKWHNERKAALLSGPHAEAANALTTFLESMSLDQGEDLIIMLGPWREADRDTRFVVLSMVSAAIVYLRECHGLAPFDDALPFSDEEPTVFELAREMLR